MEGFSESLAQELEPAWNIQITLIEPGPFRTGMFRGNMQLVPQHPAYADPELPGSKFREFMTSAPADGDTDKAVVVIEKLTHLDDPPLRIPLHRLAVGAGREKAKSLIWMTLDSTPNVAGHRKADATQSCQRNLQEVNCTVR